MRNPFREPNRELRGRIERFLTTGAFVAEGGSRACTMCGKNGKDCLGPMIAGRKWPDPPSPCCDACANGNTHPAPGENDGSCAEWVAKLGKGES